MNRIRVLMAFGWEVSLRSGYPSGYWVSLHHNLWEAIDIYDDVLNEAIKRAYSDAREADLKLKESGG